MTANIFIVHFRQSAIRNKFLAEIVTSQKKKYIYIFINLSLRRVVRYMLKLFSDVTDKTVITGEQDSTARIEQTGKE
jgi:hypothetical protein